MNNTYNFLPPTSSLRPHALLALLSLLALSSELSALPLSTSMLQTALSQWSLSPTESTSFLTSASAIYASSELLTRALEIQLLALTVQSTPEAAERAVALALADESRFALDDVLGAEGAEASLNGQMGEVVQFFSGSDAIGAVKSGIQWQSANESWVASLGQLLHGTRPSSC